MRFDQHYYTESVTSRGFGTLDYSSGLSRQEVFELEEQVIYIPPILLHGAPTEQQIEEFFPINIGFFKLNNGRYVYTHSRYIGKYHSAPGRFGNFFSHSLVLQNGQEPHFFAAPLFLTGPTKAKDFVEFRKRFSIDEDVDYVRNLKICEIQFVIDEATKSYFFKLFCDFLGSENRLHVFTQILDSVVDGWLSKKKKKVTICDDKDHLTYWMLSINFLLPLHCANQLSFASYCSNPNDSNCKLIGVTPQNDISELDSQLFRLIDATNTIKHDAQQKFSKLLSVYIHQQNFAGWLYLQNTADELNITGCDQLNTLACFLEFENNLVTSKEQDYDNLIADCRLYGITIPVLKIDFFLSATVTSNTPLFQHIAAVEFRKITSDNAIVTFKKYYDSWISDRVDLLNWLVLLYLRSQKNSDQKSVAAYTLLIHYHHLVLQHQNVGNELLNRAAETLDLPSTDRISKYENLLKWAQQLGLSEEKYPKNLRRVYSNKVALAIYEITGKYSKYDDYMFLTRNEISNLLYPAIDKLVIELPANASIDKYIALFKDIFCAVQELLGTTTKDVNVRQDFWLYYFTNYYANNNTQRKPREEFIIVMFVLFLLLNNIDLKQVGFEGARLNREEFATVDLIINSIAKDRYSRRTLEALKYVSNRL